VEAVRKLDESLKKKKAYREVFHQDSVGLRYKYAAWLFTCFSCIQFYLKIN